MKILKSKPFKVLNASVLAFTLAAGLSVTSAAAETGYWPTANPTTPSNPGVSQNYYPSPVPAGVTAKEFFGTPAFSSPDRLQFTTQEEMMAFIQNIAQTNPNAHLEIYGKSAQGRDLPLLLFTKDTPEQVRKEKKKPLIWIQNQIHGNEASATEAGLLIAKWITEGKFGDILDKINIVIVPRVNPDGSFLFQRGVTLPTNGTDANRDFIKLETPEIQALNQASSKYMPDVYLDTHEYNTAVSSRSSSFRGPDSPISSTDFAWSYNDLEITSGKNLNINSNIRDMSHNDVLPKVREILNSKGVRSTDYFTTASSGTATKKAVLTEGSTDSRIGRNANGMKQALSYLIESRGITIGRYDYERRVFATASAAAAFIDVTANNADRIKQATTQAREDLINKGKTYDPNNKVVIDSMNPQEERLFKVIRDSKLDVVEVPIIWESATKAVPTLERARPTAYIMPDTEETAVAVKKLETIGLKVEKLTKEVQTSVESFTVTSVKNISGTDPLEKEIKTNVSEATKTISAGSYVINMDQVLSSFAVMGLEPESPESYATYGFIASTVGKELPIYRYIKNDRLPTALPPSVKINVNDPVLIGADISVGLSLSNLPANVNAEQIKAQFDSNLFEFVSASAANDKSTIIAEPVVNGGTVHLLVANLKGSISGDQDIVNLVFRAKAAGVGNLQMSAEVGIGTDGTEVSAGSASQTVNIVTVIYGDGDLNQNGRYDIGDLAMVAFYYGAKAGDASWDDAKKVDVNKDGKIDIDDLAFVASKILQN
ncbi:M14 family zinc carboxypeptidase [Paenibacillus planticolens]|nr:M14 family zinc carboxypeptidase [Paenibacillus planticolens]